MAGAIKLFMLWHSIAHAFLYISGLCYGYITVVNDNCKWRLYYKHNYVSNWQLYKHITIVNDNCKSRSYCKYNYHHNWQLYKHIKIVNHNCKWRSYYKHNYDGNWQLYNILHSLMTIASDDHIINTITLVIDNSIKIIWL